MKSIVWQSIRNSLQIDPSITYLNTGTSGLVPTAVHEKALTYRTRLHRNPTDFVWRASGQELWRNRERLSEHLHTTPDRLIFFCNISQATNTLCLSIQLPPGSEILMSDHEYGSMVWAWERAAKLRNWKIRYFTLPLESDRPNDYVEAMRSAIGHQTKLLYTSHILYTTGHVLPLQAMLKFAKERELITVVDGAHAPGMKPLQLDELGADFYGANLHKWLLAPVGAAFLYCRSGMECHLEPWQVSWAYRDDLSDPNRQDSLGSTPFLRRFEMEGTRDVTPWLMVADCCDFIDSVGYPKIEERHRELSDLVRSQLQPFQGLCQVTPNTPDLRGGLTAFRVREGVDGERIRSWLWEKRKIEVNFIPHAQGPYLRISTHIYNSPEEVDRLEKSLRDYFDGADAKSS